MSRIGKRLDDADEALRQGSMSQPGYSWASIARGDQMFYATLVRGRAGLIILALSLVALAALLAWVFS
jgi:hypothetical protein